MKPVQGTQLTVLRKQKLPISCSTYCTCSKIKEWLILYTDKTSCEFTLRKCATILLENQFEDTILLENQIDSTILLENQIEDTILLENQIEDTIIL
jgi:hypothetical protein